MKEMVSRSDVVDLFPKSSPAALAMFTSRGRWKLAPHLALLNRFLLKLARRKIKRLLVSFPPRHGKSSFVSQYLTAWWLGNFPHERVILTSYGADLAFYWSSKAKQILEEYGDSVFGIHPTGASNGWAIDGYAGGVRAAGVGGPITGFGADLLIADDLIKNAEEARSEIVRNSTWDWWTSTAFTRLEPNGVVVMIATRWDLDDPPGRSLKFAANNLDTEQWTVFNFPAIAEDDEPAWPESMGRKKGQALWPERYDVTALKEIEKQLGTYWFSALFQQRPVPLGGGMFKAAWFNKRVKSMPYNADKVRSWDRASTPDGGCYTAGSLMGTEEDKFFVGDCVHGQWEPDERNQIILRTAQRDRDRWGPNHEPMIWIESEGGSTGEDANMGLGRILAGFKFRFERVTGSKDVRAEPWASMLSSGNVWLVDDSTPDRPCTWDIDGYIQEHVLFRPDLTIKRFGKYKDRVDSSASGFSYLANRKRAGTIRVYGGGKIRKDKLPRIAVCSRDELANLIIDDHRTLLVSISNPSPEANGTPPLHALGKLLESLNLHFADMDPANFQERWQDLLPPYNQPAEKLIMRPEDGKRLWSFMLRKRDPAAEVYVIQDDGGSDRRAMSLAYALADMMRLPRNTCIYKVGDHDWKATSEDKPSNPHVYAATRAARASVI